VITLLARYQQMVAAGELKPDEDQRSAVTQLDRLERDLERGGKPGLWSRLTRRRTEPVRGVYLWGGVGRGKSMLMDLAFEEIDVAPKRRVHFHEFMLEVHERLRVERGREKGDPIPPIAAHIAFEARLLAFDEMVINNSADAMILSRLFGHLLARGVTVVTTSNRPPRDLYKDGLNREHFLPFIDLIEAKLEVVSLNGPTDYRLERLGGMPTWHVPNGPDATKALSDAFFRLTDYPSRIAGMCRARTYRSRRPHPARSQEPERASRLLVQAALRRSAGRARLPRDRPAIPHRHPGRHPEARARRTATRRRGS
jgi:cell division protein ZapE